MKYPCTPLWMWDDILTEVWFYRLGMHDNDWWAREYDADWTT